MGRHREQRAQSWSGVTVSQPRAWLRWSWVPLLAGTLVSLAVALPEEASSPWPLCAAIFGGSATFFAALFRNASVRRTYGTLDFDGASLRVEGHVVAERRHLRWVFRSQRASSTSGPTPRWSVHREWYHAPLQLEFDEPRDDRRFGEQCAEYAGTPPDWGTSPVRAHIWLAVLVMLASFAAPLAVAVLAPDLTVFGVAVAMLLFALVWCPTRLSIDDGELREAWFWGVRRVRISDIEGHELVHMGQQEPASMALRLRLRSGKTRKFGVGVFAAEHRIVQALERELEQLRPTRDVPVPVERPRTTRIAQRLAHVRFDPSREGEDDDEGARTAADARARRSSPG